MRFEIKRAKHDHLMHGETSQIHGFKSQLLQKLTQRIASEMGLSLPNIGLKFMDTNIAVLSVVAIKYRFTTLQENL